VKVRAIAGFNSRCPESFRPKVV